MAREMSTYEKDRAKRMAAILAAAQATKSPEFQEIAMKTGPGAEKESVVRCKHCLERLAAPHSVLLDVSKL